MGTTSSRSRSCGRPRKVVACAGCGSWHDNALPYSAALGHPPQGSDCASYLSRKGKVWYVTGCYGSRLHDMKRYRVVRSPKRPRAAWAPPRVAGGPYCDTCVQVWINTEHLVLVEDHVL